MIADSFLNSQTKLPAELRGPPSPMRGMSTSGAAGNEPLVPNYTGATTVTGVSRLVSHFTGSSAKTGPFSAHPGTTDDEEYTTGPTPGAPRARSVSPVRRQITGGSGYLSSRGLSTSPMKTQLTGTTNGGWFPGSSNNNNNAGSGASFMAPLVPQMTGGGLPVTHAYATPRPHSVVGHARNVGMVPLKSQWTGSSTTSSTGGGGGGGGGLLSPQTTGGGLFVTRPRPKSVLGSRGMGGSSHRGIELVRQMTGGSEWRS